MLIIFSFAFCIIFGVPIFASLGIPAMVYFYKSNIPFSIIPQSLYTGADNFPLLAVPCFILAGSIMEHGNITEQIINVVDEIVGRIYGGLAIVTIGSCMFFSAISGSGPGTVAAVGTIMIPSMVRQGYSKAFAGAVASSGGVLGILIPPSNPMIIYGVIGGISVTKLFAAGLLPGIIIGIILSFVAYAICRKQGYRGSKRKFSFIRLLKLIYRGKFALLMPFIILGGIYSGVFTPVEASVVAVCYALFIGLVVNRTLSFSKLKDSFSEACITSGSLMLIIGTATLFGKMISLYQLPSKITSFMLSITSNWFIILSLIVVCLIILGTFFETLSTVIILTPVLLPLLIKLGVDPIHFGVIFVITNEVGFLTPPLGINLFVACSLTGLGIEQISKSVLPFIIVLIVSIWFFILLPILSLFLVKFV